MVERDVGGVGVGGEVVTDGSGDDWDLPDF